jgi:hypothetical protein
MSTPTLIFTPDSDQEVKVDVAWTIEEADASCWRAPISVCFRRGEVDTVVFLSREEGRLIRDFLTSIIQSPDLRDADEPTKHD